MSFQTASHHCITEMVFVRADDLRNEVVFRTASHSESDTHHTTILNVITGKASCNCWGAKRGECWHETLAMAAFHALPAYHAAYYSTTEQLTKTGIKMARMCRIYRSRIWRVLPDHALTLICCRAVWHHRRMIERANVSGQAVA